MTDRESDRELLELAAKAAGYEFGEINGTFKAMIEQDFGTCGTYGCQKHQWRDWNPLTDDGDALRLAATTGLVVDFQCRFGIGNVVGTGVWRHGHMEGPPEFWTAHGSDAGAASRYTIVRAAAEIGRQHD